MVDYIPVEKGSSFRYPSVALLSVDSTDRFSDVNNTTVEATSANFTFNPTQSILNGFFTRIAVTEIVLDWGVDNISAYAGNNIIAVDVSGAGLISTTVPEGRYNIKQALDEIVVQLNDGIVGTVFSLVDVSGSNLKHLKCQVGGVDRDFTIYPDGLQTQLNLLADTEGNYFPINNPKLLPYTYLDFCCDNLTYCQNVKDQTTNYFLRNLLYRWNFAFDNNPGLQYDAYGYPILQGYQSFVYRRELTMPKQIRWEGSLPIGQLNFQVYTSQGKLLEPGGPGVENNMEWAMSIQVSEV